MGKSKTYFESSIQTGKRDAPTNLWTSRRSLTPRLHLPRKTCKDHFSLIEPQISAEGIHVWPFDASCPIDVQFFTQSGRHHVRMNRHEYFEVLFMCSGSADCHIQDRLLPIGEGDLVVIGSTLYHQLESRSSSPFTVAALFFEPDLIRCSGGSDGVEYLTPFFRQDSDFPHVVPAKTGVAYQVLEMMLRIRSELPASSPRARLAVKTYLKMLLVLLVNHFSSYAGTLETFQRQRRALDRLLPLFRYLAENCGNTIPVQEASRVCGMSESHFMSFFKRLTGLSFVKYLNHYRIERAQVLLASTDESMAEISQELGFCDQSYFGMVFRRFVGTTPADYRRYSRNNPSTDCGQRDHTPPVSSSRFFLLEPPSRGTAEINHFLATPRAQPFVHKVGT